MQAIDSLYCVGDSCFPGQGVIAVAFSGVMCAHRVAADLGKFEIEPPYVIWLKQRIDEFFFDQTI